MLRITKEADYGIVLLAIMAEQEPGEIHTAREAAERSGLPLPMVSKIMRSLARGDVLTSHRGVTGGYSLDRSPADTTVAEVIRAIDGPISMVQCGVEPGACEQEPSCPTRVNWARISREVERALESIPISEMLTAEDRRELLRIGDDPPHRGVEN
jgi:FeS assembly SUF system regulator